MKKKALAKDSTEKVWLHERVKEEKAAHGN